MFSAFDRLSVSSHERDSQSIPGPGNDSSSSIWIRVFEFRWKAKGQRSDGKRTNEMSPANNPSIFTSMKRAIETVVLYAYILWCCRRQWLQRPPIISYSWIDKVIERGAGEGEGGSEGGQEDGDRWENSMSALRSVRCGKCGSGGLQNETAEMTGYRQGRHLWRQIAFASPLILKEKHLRIFVFLDSSCS